MATLDELVGKLSEEDKASILNEVERERRRVLVTRMYDEGMSSDDSSIRYGTAQSLAALAQVDSDKFVELWEKGINDKNEDVRKGTAGTLAALASIDQYKFIELWEKYLSKEELDKVKYRGGYIEIIAETLFALVPINPYKFVELWEKWRHEKEHCEERDIVIGTLATLASIKPNKFIELAEKVINHIFDNYNEETVAKILVALAPINPNRFIELYEKGIKLKDEYSYETRYEVARTLAALATVNPSKFVELCEKGINSEDFHIRMGTTYTLTALAFINQKKFVELYEKGINDEDEQVRYKIAETLGALASVNPDKFVELYEKGMCSEDREIRVSISESSALLVAINPDRFIELYKKERNDVCGRVKMNLAHGLSVLAKIREEEFIKLYEEGIAGNDEESKRFIVKSLEGLVDTNPQKFVELYEKAVVHPNKEVRMGAADIISRLADIDPDRFTRLCASGLNDNEEFIRLSSAKSLGKLAIVNPHEYVKIYKEAISRVKDPEFLPILNKIAESLAALASTITQETLIPIEDEGYNFITAYLDSRYVQNSDGNCRTKEDLKQELINLVRNSEGLDYTKLKRILDVGQAKDLDEMIECSKVNVKNYRVLKKVGEGAFKNVYLAESEKSSGYFVVLKQINPSQFGIDSIGQHYPSFKDWLNEELHITKLAKLKSPYIARPEAPIEGEDGNIYLVEEPFKETLRRKLKREGKLSIEETLKIALQISQGLKDAHNYAEGQIIHRDLKPSNIGLDENGNVKLTDFGSLESMSRSPRDGDLSNILYSAPEVLEGGKTTVRSNIYSVGVLLYEMITGENLFAPREEDGTLKSKPKEVGEEREVYKQEVLENIESICNLALKERKDKLRGDIAKIEKYQILKKCYGYNLDRTFMKGFAYFAKIISGCIAYEQVNRVYNSMEELKEDIIKVISLLECKIDIDVLSSTMHDTRKEDSDETTQPLLILYRYKEVMEPTDYRKLKAALRKK